MEVLEGPPPDPEATKAPHEQVTKDGQVFLESDISRSKAWGLNQRASVYRALIWAACSGRISSLIGGPPCRWSILRSRPMEGFPCPERDAQHLYGLDELSPKERVKVNQDTKHLWIWMQRKAHDAGGASPI